MAGKEEIGGGGGFGRKEKKKGGRGRGNAGQIFLFCSKIVPFGKVKPRGGKF